MKEHELLSLQDLPSRLVPLSHGNAQDFYNALRLELSSYNIPLLDWNEVQTPDSIIDLDEHTTGNFESAKRVMARALYKFLDRRNELLFDSTTHFSYELETHAKSMDGFNFLASILRVMHPKLQESAFHTCASLGVVPPIFRDDCSVYKFLRECTEYFDARPSDPLQHTLYVKDELGKDPRFKTVMYTLAKDLHPYMNGNGYLPSNLCVNNLHVFLNSHLTQQELLQIS